MSFFYGMLRHTIWAMSFFAGFSILMEWIIPGSVSPYIDPLPFFILALFGYVIDASNRTVFRDRRIRLFGVLPAVAIGCAFLFMGIAFHGRTSIIVAGLGVFMMVLMGCSIAFSGKGSRNGSDEKKLFTL